MQNSVRLIGCLPAIAGIALLASSAQAQVTKIGDSYQFHVKYHKGMKFRFLVKITTTLPSPQSGGEAQSISMTLPFDGTVTDVQNSIATVKMTTGPGTMNGQQQGAAQTVEVKMNDRGKLVSGAPAGIESIASSLPDKPLKVGESYTTKQDLNMTQLPINVTAVYKFLGLKSSNGRQYAQFKVTLNGSGNIPSQQGAGGKFTTQGTGTREISAEDGLMAHAALDLEVSSLQGTQTMKLKTRTTVERQ